MSRFVYRWKLKKLRGQRSKPLVPQALNELLLDGVFFLRTPLADLSSAVSRDFVDLNN